MTQQFDAVRWFADRGDISYQEEIADLRAQRDELVAENKHPGAVCMYGNLGTMLASIDAEIMEIRATALDRYRDWAED